MTVPGVAEHLAVERLQPGVHGDGVGLRRRLPIEADVLDREAPQHFLAGPRRLPLGARRHDDVASADGDVADRDRRPQPVERHGTAKSGGVVVVGVALRAAGGARRRTASARGRSCASAPAEAWRALRRPRAACRPSAAAGRRWTARRPSAGRRGRRTAQTASCPSPRAPRGTRPSRSTRRPRPPPRPSRRTARPRRRRSALAPAATGSAASTRGSDSGA